MELLHAVVEEFTTANTNEARMQIASKFYSPHSYDKEMEANFQEVKNVTNFKSQQMSVHFRTEGNTAYQEGKIKVALDLYSQSIANAQSGSIELSLAFANRSAVLRTMRKCRECLVDIERALAHGYPRDKSFKLLLREMQCYRDLGHEDEMETSFIKAYDLLQSLARLTEQEKADLQQQLDQERQAPDRVRVCPEVVIYPKQVPELSFGSNPEVMGASSAVRIGYNKRQGRHLVATRDIEIGDVLLIAEHLAVTLREIYRFDHCAHCHKLCHNLLPCPNCALVMFCSNICQTEANQKYHAAECAPLSRMRHILASVIIATGFDLYDRVFRVLAMIGFDNLEPYLKYARTVMSDNSSIEAERTKGFNSQGVFDPSTIDMLFNLRTNVEQQDPSDLVMNSLFYIQIPRCFGMPMSHPDFFAVVGLCLQLLDTSFVASSSKTYIRSVPVEFRDIAVCFNPLNSLVQHSCVSNTTSLTYGNKCVTIAKCPIPEGTVITESFLNADLRYTKADRHNLLKSQYTFTCFCDACLRDKFYDARMHCITNPSDIQILSDMLRCDEKKIIKMCKNMASPGLDTFKKERYKILIKLWNKGEFHDIRFSDIQHQLEVYESMKGNRVVYNVNQDQN